MFRSLRGRNYALFFAGQGVSVVGTWMQSTALSWLVYRLTGDPFMLGLVQFVAQLPAFLISPIAGVYADRWNRHKMLLVMQSLMMLQAVSLTLLTLTGQIQVWQIVCLALFMGMLNAVDIPNRQSFVVQMVPRREDLPNGIALNSFLFNGARLVGPSIAGFVIWAVDPPHQPGTPLTAADMRGEGLCFLSNAISYAAVLAAVLAMRIAPRAIAPRKHVLHELRDGLRYTMGFPPIRTILLMLAMLGMVAMPYATLVPVFARDVLHGDSKMQGYLLSMAGCGALVAAIFLAARSSVRGLGRLIALAPVLMGASLIVFGFSQTAWLSLPVLALIGFGQMTQMAGSNTLLQTIVDDDKRGRVMSFYALAFMGTGPFGNLLVGYLAKPDVLGEQWTVAIAGAITAGCGLLFLSYLPTLRRHVRPIYVKMGIISDIGMIPKEAAEEDVVTSGETNARN